MSSRYACYEVLSDSCDLQRFQCGNIVSNTVLTRSEGGRLCLCRYFPNTLFYPYINPGYQPTVAFIRAR